MRIDFFGKPYDVTPNVTKYMDGNLAIQLICTNGEPFGNLTVNLGEMLPPNMAYVDVNNMPDAERFIKEYNLGEPIGTTRRSGYCTYPLYKFKEDLQ